MVRMASVMCILPQVKKKFNNESSKDYIPLASQSRAERDGGHGPHLSQQPVHQLAPGQHRLVRLQVVISVSVERRERILSTWGEQRWKKTQFSCPSALDPRVPGSLGLGAEGGTEDSTGPGFHTLLSVQDRGQKDSLPLSIYSTNIH